MKTKTTDKIMLKAGAFLLSFCMLLGVFTWVGALQVSAVESDDRRNGQTLTEELGGEALDPYAALVYVNGKIVMGTDALSNPICAKYKINFVQTSTGFANGGATIEDIELIKSSSNSKVEAKASGAIENRNQALVMFRSGAARIGTSREI